MHSRNLRQIKCYHSCFRAFKSVYFKYTLMLNISPSFCDVKPLDPFPCTQSIQLVHLTCEDFVYHFWLRKKSLYFIKATLFQSIRQSCASKKQAIIIEATLWRLHHESFLHFLFQELLNFLASPLPVLLNFP